MSSLPSSEHQGPESALLYDRVAQRIESLIDGGTLRPGDRIPSVRKLSRQLSVSVSTVLEAYRRLEDRRLVEARPQSGYYVRLRASAPDEPVKTTSCCEATTLSMGRLVMRIIGVARDPDIVLGAAIPSSEFFPASQLSRILARVAREEVEATHRYGTVPGEESLRIQIARRLLDGGCAVRPDEIIVTSGAQQAVELALRCITRPGDTVIVETPTYYALLQILENLGLKALEIATDPREGICLDDLELALKAGPVAALVLVPTFGNPLGHCMSEAARERLAALLKDHDVPLVEDDVYGELPFEGPRPRAIKSFDDDGRIMLCSSLSKTLAPGYRVGWCVPGRLQPKFEELRFATSVTSASPTQLAVARYLEAGGFDHHLRRLRRTYKDLMRRVLDAVGEHFPEATRATRPAGGHMVWVELPSGVDSVALHDRALERGLSVVPGTLFSATGRYRNFIRLNTALPWTPRVESALATLGELVTVAARGR